ncbi:hypothetical protein MMC18_004121 [Xylographa bjoerkii]|nr:hypothetical protein [Xylographa bjoerkii]
MDPLSVAASIIAVIQISQQLFDLCQTYYKEVKNARKNIKRLRDEVTALSDILTQVSDLADEPGADELATLDIIKSPLQRCSRDLLSLAERLGPGHGKEMKHVENTQANVAAHRAEEYRTSMIQWLYGIPGCGKTILSSTIVKHLVSEYESNPQIVVVYFYFDFNTGEKQNVSNCLSSLVGQICHHSGLVPKELQELHNKCNIGNQRPALFDLAEIMKIYTTCSDLQDIYVVLDALDECPKGDLRDELLNLITDICSWSPSNIHLIVTSRQEPDIQEALSPSVIGAAISIQGSQVEADIEAYVDYQIAICLRRLSADLKEEIKDALLQHANGMFRWVFCQVEVLKKCPPIRAAIRNALGSLPATLDGTYARVLESIEDQTCQELARRSLLWLAFSRAPLRLEELADAAVVGTGSIDPEDRISDPQFILELLGSLVIVSSIEYIVEDPYTITEWFRDDHPESVRSDAVRLAHLSVKEYLTSERIVQSALSKFALGSAMAHGQIAEACMLYLDFYQHLESRAMPRFTSCLEKVKDTKDLPPGVFNEEASIPYLCNELEDKGDLTSSADKDLSSYPLLRYACHFWWHLRQIPLRKQRDLDYIVWKLFHKNTISALPTWLMARTFRGDEYWRKNRSTLHLFTLFGIEGAVQLQLERGAYVNARNCEQQTALHLAVRYTYHHIVRLLLEHGATNNAEDKWSNTPLMNSITWGSLSGNASLETTLATLQLLLEHEDKTHDCKELSSYPDNQKLPSVILINKVNRVTWHTPLHYGTMYGSVQHCKFLLERGADVESQNICGDNPLHWAIGALGGYGSLDKVRLLLDYGSDALAKNDRGITPLELAKKPQCSRDVFKTIQGKVENAVQKYDDTTRQAMETARRDRRKAEIRRLMVECPIHPLIYNERDYGYDLWREFYNDQTGLETT